MLTKFLNSAIAILFAIMVVGILAAVFLKDPAPNEKAPVPKLELSAIEKSVSEQLPAIIDEVIVTAPAKTVTLK